MASFIKLIPGETEQLNHFISYKEIDKEWYKYDDQEVEIVKLKTVYICPSHFVPPRKLYNQI